jgi:hypothetical protein
VQWWVTSLSVSSKVPSSSRNSTRSRAHLAVFVLTLAALFAATLFRSGIAAFQLSEFLLKIHCWGL